MQLLSEGWSKVILGKCSCSLRIEVRLRDCKYSCSFSDGKCNFYVRMGVRLIVCRCSCSLLVGVRLTVNVAALYPNPLNTPTLKEQLHLPTISLTPTLTEQLYLPSLSLTPTLKERLY